jgi:hypothetical protein
MPYYLAPYRGSGTRSDPFRPVGSDQPGWSAIDLRADKGVTVDGGGWGFALLYLPPGTTAPAQVIKLAEDPKETIALTTRQVLTSRLPLDFSKDQIIEDVFSTLLLKPPDGWWNALRPANGFYEAWLGGQRILSQPVIAGGTLSDDFNRADETPLAAPWSRLTGSTGNINLISNAITASAIGEKLYSYTAPFGWNADHSSEFTYAAAIPNHDWSLCVRVGANGFSAYVYDQFSGGRQIGKYVNGTFSTIEVAAGSASVGTAYRISVSGSTIRYYDGGTENANSPATDTSLTTAGNGPGVFIYETGGSLDDWVGTGELAGGLAGPLVGCRLLGVKGLVS